MNPTHHRLHRQLRLVLAPLALCAAVTINASAQIHHVAQLNTEQIRALDRAKTVVLLPGSILEQHGPYLPSFTDGYANERLTQEVANAIVERPGWHVLIFPTIPLGFGGANEIGRKYSFPGSYTVRAATLRAVFMDLATELGEQGFRWIFVIHVHGAPIHNRMLDQAGDYFRDVYHGHMVNLFGLIGPVRLGSLAESGLTEQAKNEDGFSVHAGLVETSRMLFLRPDLVNPAVFGAPSFTGKDMDDLVRIAKLEKWPGYFGAPRHATASVGARMWMSLSSAYRELAMKILDGQDYGQVQRHADLRRTVPANVSIDRDALEHDQMILRKQEAWLETRKVQ